MNIIKTIRNAEKKSELTFKELVFYYVVCWVAPIALAVASVFSFVIWLAIITNEKLLAITSGNTAFTLFILFGLVSGFCFCVKGYVDAKHRYGW